MQRERFSRAGVLACVAGAALLALYGCATPKRPVLYPNAKYQQVGEAGAQRDVDACIRLAEASGATHGGGERVLRRGAEGAAVGGATGAVVGAVHGGGIGERAAAGAAVGATAAAVHGAMRSDEPDAVHKGFVRRCLRERGYEVIGWR